MRLLLDTHALLWWLADDSRLKPEAREQIAHPSNLVHVSAATVWEVGIKQQLGKLKAPEHLVDIIQEEGFETLAITAAHAHEAARLPMHHRDPFGRMLIAQARMEGLELMTHDEVIQAYEADVLPL
ncbi:MAG: hypothetical protein A2286_04780 [Gammaproteobacteria bacterium RIFOXYA12_FULL_61_12]|nr:MAG: hypothetical protein A2514_12620 [Gammaproteobacteria bacterium RIFOXYD12_FULL_61_37]OGT94011.1 MAG: hypothetical protein A2286_04780 [Gammaproteobacteria bacterium RIFOXYA12_FULL_61_12]